MNDYGDLFAQAVAAELRAERARKGITLAQLVEESGIAQSSIQRYLKGTRDIPVSALIDICRVLTVSPRLIFERAENSVE
ncbi:helix-turn-helix domain-containing protein [Leucobacter luti]|uniref:helix-turn-helix domain-containing protein n=1 Tax=Leucobacter luti TaxID=340320 RepID=UPI001404C31F|nr:helix-turn-helix transcriptional regulator [Leucobacter luti]MCW2286991.1 transcriptional regulator with XRE-family HTH domain [Leucobacter luti]